MRLVAAELEQVARNAIGFRPIAHRMESRYGFGAQVVDFFLRHVARIPERGDRPRAREQQVATDQVGQPEVRVCGDQRFNAFKGLVELVLLDGLEDL